MRALEYPLTHFCCVQSEPFEHCALQCQGCTSTVRPERNTHTHTTIQYKSDPNFQHAAKRTENENGPPNSAETHEMENNIASRMHRACPSLLNCAPQQKIHNCGHSDTEKNSEWKSNNTKRITHASNSKHNEKLCESQTERWKIASA